ncbi:MAG: efflux RND transporter periplasmic adaptor subunit [Nitrospinota bacterium]
MVKIAPDNRKDGPRPLGGSCVFRLPTAFGAGRAAVALILATLLSGARAEGQTQPYRAPLVVVQPAVSRLLRGEVTAVGTVEPALQTTVSAEVAGLVRQAGVEEGDRVVRGKTALAQLGGSALRIELAEARAALRRATEEWKRLKAGSRPEEVAALRAQLEEKRALMERDRNELRRAENLFNKAILDRSSYDRAKSNYLASKSQYERAKQQLRLAEAGERAETIAAARAEVERARARVARIRDDLRKTTIRAPVTGFVARKHVEVGQWVERGGRVADLIAIDRVHARIGVAERHIRFLRVGDPARVLLDALPGQVFRGRVSAIIPQADTASRNFPVKVELTNTPDFQIKSGMFARVAIQYGEARRAVLIPKDALLSRERGHAVFVVVGTQASLRPVQVGREVEGLIQVLDGKVDPGDMVVVEGNETLYDGVRVRLKGTSGPPAARPRAPRASGGRR